MSQIIDGKKIAEEIKKDLKSRTAAVKAKGVEPCLAVVLIGRDPASQVYVKNKKNACAQTGVKSAAYELESASEEELLALIENLNNDSTVHGILVQLPLPKNINANNILRAINPEKDADGFHPYNAGLLAIGDAGPLPCTPAGIIELLKRTEIEISGKNCVVIGRSAIVGKPAAMLLLKENGTVTVCHSKTSELSEITKKADILVAAVGKPRFVVKDMIKEGAVVIDVGIHRLDSGLCGDVDYDGCKEKASYITPVPGGVGPMTIAMLMKNCVEFAERKVGLC